MDKKTLEKLERLKVLGNTFDYLNFEFRPLLPYQLEFDHLSAAEQPPKPPPRKHNEKYNDFYDKLEKLLLSIDAVTSDGCPFVREERKKLVTAVQIRLKELEQMAKDHLQKWLKDGANGPSKTQQGMDSIKQMASSRSKKSNAYLESSADDKHSSSAYEFTEDQLSSPIDDFSDSDQPHQKQLPRSIPRFNRYQQPRPEFQNTRERHEGVVIPRNQASFSGRYQSQNSYTTKTNIKKNSYVSDDSSDEDKDFPPPTRHSTTRPWDTASSRIQGDTYSNHGDYRQDDSDCDRDCKDVDMDDSDDMDEDLPANNLRFRGNQDGSRDGYHRPKNYYVTDLRSGFQPPPKVTRFEPINQRDFY